MPPDTTARALQKYIRGAASLGLIAFLTSCASSYLSHIRAEEFTFLDHDGRTRSLAEFRGRPVVVEFWATWCGPCRGSLPELAFLQAGSEGDRRYAVIPVSVDRGGWPVVDEFVQRTGLVGQGFRPYVPHLRSADHVFGSFRIIPRTFVIDREGRVVAAWTGYLPGRIAAEVNALPPRG